MAKADYENPPEKTLDRTDPSGNQTVITPAKSYKTCHVCNAHCQELGHDKKNKCWGQVNMMNVTAHLCGGHKNSLNNPSRYYVSEPQKQDGPIGQMMAEAK